MFKLENYLFVNYLNFIYFDRALNNKKIYLNMEFMILSCRK